MSTTIQSSSTTESGGHCADLCAGADVNNVGDCCAVEYCDCSDYIEKPCGHGEVFCPVYNGGSCMMIAIVGEECQELGDDVCCSSGP